MTAYYQLIERGTDAAGTVTAHYRSTPLAQGAWNEHEQDMAPATGIICAELELLCATQPICASAASAWIFWA